MEQFTSVPFAQGYIQILPSQLRDFETLSHCDTTTSSRDPLGLLAPILTC